MDLKESREGYGGQIRGKKGKGEMKLNYYLKNRQKSSFSPWEVLTVQDKNWNSSTRCHAKGQTTGMCF